MKKVLEDNLRRRRTGEEQREEEEEEGDERKVKKKRKCGDLKYIHKFFDTPFKRWSLILLPQLCTGLK